MSIPPPPPFYVRRSPDLSDFDFIGAMMAFGGWPNVPWDKAERNLMREVRTKTPFDTVNAASIHILDGLLNAELVKEGIAECRTVAEWDVGPFERAVSHIVGRPSKRIFVDMEKVRSKANEDYRHEQTARSAVVA